MKKEQIFALFFLVLLISTACFNVADKKNEKKEVEILDKKYAKGFDIKYYDNYKLLSVINPWQNAENIIFKYYLVNDSVNVPQNIADKNVIKTPVKKVVCFSTTHIAFLDFIDNEDCIVATSGTNFIYNKKLKAKIKSNKIHDIGYEQSINYELILSLNPDIIFVYGIDKNTTSYVQKLSNLGLNVVYIGEYLEDNVLAVTEWSKFIAAFFNKEELAIKKFNRLDKEFNDLVKLTQNIENKPNILINAPYKGNWFISGNESYIAQLIKASGANYLWSDMKGREAVPVSFEEVINKASNADIWINAGSVNSYNEIKNIDQRIAELNVYKNKKIYNNNKRMSKNGGNDYWESGIVNPHLILKDLIAIFHPELIENHQLYYYKKLE